MLKDDGIATAHVNITELFGDRQNLSNHAILAATCFAVFKDQLVLLVDPKTVLLVLAMDMEPRTHRLIMGSRAWLTEVLPLATHLDLHVDPRTWT